MQKVNAKIVLALLGAMLGHTAVFADGLVVTPQRVVLEGRQRETKVTLSNLGDRETTYRLYFVNYRMGADGQFIPVTAPNEADATADRFVRYSPRQVRLAPGETQIVRLLVRMPPAAQPGEYRSHLVIQGLPPVEKEPALKPTPGHARTSIRTLYGVSIPVIVRRGRPTAQVNIVKPTLDAKQKQPAVSFVLARDGEASVYGDLTVFGQLVTDGTWRPIARSLGIAVYPPLQERSVQLPLGEGVAADALEAIRIEYVEPQTNRVIAQTTRRLR